VGGLKLFFVDDETLKKVAACYFYDPEEKKCQVYEYRPLGCFIYPVIYSNDEGVITDEICPMRYTISKRELKMKGQILLKHLEDNE